MIVGNILKDKGATVYSVRDTETVGDAVEILGEKNIGAVIVLTMDGRPAGILSERDIVQRLATDGASVLSLSATDVMSTDVVTCTNEDTVDHLMGLMTQRRIRHVPVVDKGELKGMISIGDVVKRRIEETEREAEELKSYIAAS